MQLIGISIKKTNNNLINKISMKLPGICSIMDNWYSALIASPWTKRIYGNLL